MRLGGAGRWPFGDEGAPGGGEAVAIVEAVPAHLRELPHAAGLQRQASLVLGPAVLLGRQQPRVVRPIGERRRLL
jgi:hypothetical protein